MSPPFLQPSTHFPNIKLTVQKYYLDYVPVSCLVITIRLPQLDHHKNCVGVPKSSKKYLKILLYKHQNLESNQIKSVLLFILVIPKIKLWLINIFL